MRQKGSYIHRVRATQNNRENDVLVLSLFQILAAQLEAFQSLAKLCHQIGDQAQGKDVVFFFFYFAHYETKNFKLFSTNVSKK